MAYLDEQYTTGPGTAPRRGARRLRLLTEAQRERLRPELLDVIEYRKPGLSVNWIVGCPLDCGYCVRHLFGNFGMKVPRALMSEERAVELLVGHRLFEPRVTPIQLLNRATDPMLPAVKPHTLAMLRLLDVRRLTNHVLVITRWRVEPGDCAVLNSLRNIKLTLLVTHSGITDTRIEPVDSTIAEASLRAAFAGADLFRVVLYWRPIVPGLNDSDAHLEQAFALSHHAHTTVFTGLFFRDEIRDYYPSDGLPEPYPQGARRKVFPESLERRILAAAGARQGGSPLFRKTSCAVSYAHGLADHNGPFGIRELCEICPATQQRTCASFMLMRLARDTDARLWVVREDSGHAMADPVRTAASRDSATVRRGGDDRNGFNTTRPRILLWLRLAAFHAGCTFGEALNPTCDAPATGHGRHHMTGPAAATTRGARP